MFSSASVLIEMFFMYKYTIHPVLRIRIRIGSTDPQSETDADPQHSIHLCVYMDSFRNCCYVVGTFSSVVVSGTDRIRAGARRLQSGQLQVLAAPAFPA
jgi:hypothetical protein